MKANFKKLRAKKFVGQLQDSHEALVAQAIGSVGKTKIAKCVDHVNKLLN